MSFKPNLLPLSRQARAGLMRKPGQSAASAWGPHRGIILLVALLLSACVPNDAPTPEDNTSTQSSSASLPMFVNWPKQVENFRFRWSAAEGTDLQTGPAVALRAYVESYRLVGMMGGDVSVVYPGFLRATPENSPEAKERGDLVQLQYVRPRTRAELERNGWTYREKQVFGYQPTHVLDLVPDGEGYRATVCLGLYSVFEAADDGSGQYISVNADTETGRPRYPDGIEVWRVDLTDRDPRANQSTAAPTTPQAGPLPAPVDDVFGPWFVTGFSANLWGPLGDVEDVDTQEVRAQCADAMPDDAAARSAMSTGVHAAPPPHGDPVPGWPEHIQ